MYADGRVIWQKWTSSGDATVVPDGARRLDTGYVQQRLTPQGVQLLLSKILATGLFEHNLRLDVGRHHAWVFHQVRRGDRLVTVSGVPSPDPSWNQHFTKPTPAQTRRSRRSRNSWPIRPVGFRRERGRTAGSGRSCRLATWSLSIGAIPISRSCQLQPRKVLVQYKQLKRHGCQILTTGQARALLQAFVKAGISPSENHAFDYRLRFRRPAPPAPLRLPHVALPFQTLAASSPATCPGARPSAPENAPAAATDMAGAAHERPVRVAVFDR